MGARTIRLDPSAEQALAEVTARTGLSVSEALRRGILALRAGMEEEEVTRPYEVFQTLNLGPGGEAIAPARRAKTALRGALKDKVRR